MTLDLAQLLSQPATISPRTLDPDFVEAVDEWISGEVKSGYAPIDSIVERAMEYASVEAPEDDELAYARQQLAQALRKQVAEQDAMSNSADYDRMAGALAKLEAGGVVCRENYTCCMTCGSAEIWDEINGMVESGKKVDGYAFFHQQDTESAAEGRGLYFAYGATDDADAASVAIGERLRQAMEEAGLKVEWNGSIQQRINVVLDWFRPLPDEIAAVVRQTPLPA